MTSTTERQFTAGPWSLPHFAEPGTGCQCGYVLMDRRMGAICTVHASGPGTATETGDNPPFEEAVANARLIAQAPALVEALEALLPHMRWATDCDLAINEKMERDVARARTVLSRALGRE